MMKRLCITVAALVGLAVAALAYPWESQKTVVNKFYVNLSGTAPTAANMATNFVKAGDVIVDSSIQASYLVTDPTKGSYVMIDSNGAVTKITGATGLFLTNSVITNQVAYFQINGTNVVVVTNVVQTNSR